MGSKGSKGGEYRLKLNRHTHTHTSEKCVAKVAKVASIDSGKTETHTHTSEKWVAKVAKVANIDSG